MSVLTADIMKEMNIQGYMARMSPAIRAERGSAGTRLTRVERHHPAPRVSQTSDPVRVLLAMHLRDYPYLLTDTSRQIARLLLQLGMPPHLSGYRFMLYAVSIELASPGAVHSITCRVYPEIARVFGSTPSRVERCIRNAVSIMWQRGDGKQYLRAARRIGLPSYKPTNTEIIAQLAEYIRLGE